MKPRRVVLTVEVETAIPLSRLRKTRTIVMHAHPADWGVAAEVLQISANVIRAPKKRKGKR